MQERHEQHGSGPSIRPKQLVFAIPVGDGDGMRYFTDAEADAEPNDEDAREALTVVGAWSDLNWDDAIEQLDRIRHESRPTPPFDEL